MTRIAGRTNRSATHAVAPKAMRGGPDSVISQIELMPTATYVCDQRGVIVGYNERAAQLWGRAPELGDITELYCGFAQRYRRDGSMLPRDTAPMAHALMSGRRVNDFELVAERRDRSRCSILMNVGLLRDQDGGVLGAMGCMQDVAAWKQAADAARQDELVKGVQGVVREIAHSYSNIVAATGAQLNMARRRAGEGPATKFLDGAVRSLEQGVEYTLGLSAFSREAQPLTEGQTLAALTARFALSEMAGRAEATPGRAEDDRTVLVVDDEPGLRAVARDALSSLGFGVVDADGGHAALDIIRSGCPLRLMVVDIGMKPMNGIEFLEQARALRPELKALMMTGHPDGPEDVTVGRQRTAVLRKPFGIDELAASLNRLIT
jgi:CheY-like chemotaxis protein